MHLGMHLGMHFSGNTKQNVLVRDALRDAFSGKNMPIRGGVMQKKWPFFPKKSGFDPPYYHFFARKFADKHLIYRRLSRKISEKCVCGGKCRSIPGRKAPLC